MLMFLLSLNGVSDSAYFRSVLVPFQGAVQGNSAALVLWLIISIILIHYLYSLGLVSKYHTPISGIAFQLAALIYVDSSDLNVLNLAHKSILEVVEKV